MLLEGPTSGLSPYVAYGLHIRFSLCKMVEVKVCNKDMIMVSNCMWMDGGGKTRLSIQAITRAVVRELQHLSNI